MGEAFDKKFSEGFLKDIYELLQSCIDYNAKALTITIDHDDDIKFDVRMEFKVYKGAKKEDGCIDGTNNQDLGEA